MNMWELVGSGIVLMVVWKVGPACAKNIGQWIFERFCLELNDSDHRFVSYKALKVAIGFRQDRDLLYLTIEFPEKEERLSYRSLSDLFNDSKALRNAGLVDLEQKEKSCDED